jgi:hypothetical protein
MSTLNSSFGLEYAPTPFLLRFGRREILVTRDFRKRFYPVNPIIECDTGVEPGHVEVLLLRRWLLILSKAHLIHKHHRFYSFSFAEQAPTLRRCVNTPERNRCSIKRPLPSLLPWSLRPLRWVNPSHRRRTSPC